MHEYFVYILECCDNSYYVGVTNSIERRFQEHQNGINPGCYTFNKRPLKLVYLEKFKYILDAIAREKQLKGWSRRKKKALIDNNLDLLKEYSKSSLKDKL